MAVQLVQLGKAHFGILTRYVGISECCHPVCTKSAILPNKSICKKYYPCKYNVSSYKIWTVLEINGEWASGSRNWPLTNQFVKYCLKCR